MTDPNDIDTKLSAWEALTEKRLRVRIAQLERENERLMETNRKLNRRVGALEHAVNTQSEKGAWYRYFMCGLDLYHRSQEECKKLKAENKRLKAPVSSEEMEEHGHKDDWGVKCLYQTSATELIAARAAEPGGTDAG